MKREKPELIIRSLCSAKPVHKSLNLPTFALVKKPAS